MILLSFDVMKLKSMTAPSNKLQRNEVHTEPHKNPPYWGSQMSIVLIYTLHMPHFYIAQLLTTNTNERYQLTAGTLQNHDAASRSLKLFVRCTNLQTRKSVNLSPQLHAMCPFPSNYFVDNNNKATSFPAKTWTHPNTQLWNRWRSFCVV